MKKILFLLALIPVFTHATNFFWTGGGTNTDWNNPTNWGGSGHPQSGDLAYFTEIFAVVTISAPASASGIEIIDSGLGSSVVVAGSSLTLNFITTGTGANTSGSFACPLIMAGGALELFSDNNISNLIIDNSISGNGNLSLYGGGAFSLNASCNYTGSTTFFDESSTHYNLNLTTTNVFPAATALTISSGTIDIQGHDQQVGSLQGAGNLVSTSGTPTFTVGNNNTTNFSGVIGNAIALTKVGLGTLTLLGANTYSGTTTVNGGKLIGGRANAFGTSALVMTSGTLDLGGFAQSFTSLSGASGTINSTGSAVLTINYNGIPTTIYGGAIANGSSGSVSLKKDGTGTLILTGTNIYSGGTTVNKGMLQVTYNSLPLYLTTVAAGATLDFSQSSTGAFSAQITGAGNVSKDDIGVLTLSGSNDYSGTTTVNGGKLIGGRANAFGTSALVMTSGTLDLGGFAQSFTSLSGASGTINSTGSAALTINYNGVPTTIYGGTIANGSSGSVSLKKDGTGTLLLTGTNIYSGGTIITAGTLQGNTDSLKGNIANNAAIIFDQATDGTYAGNISGAGTFTKQNNGMLIVTGTSTVSTADIMAGTFAVNGSIGGTGDLVIHPSATLQGVGTILQNIKVQGILSPGNSIGTLHVAGNVSFPAGSYWINEINPTQTDLLAITVGSLDVTGATLVILADPGKYAPHPYTIATASAVTGPFASLVFSPLFQVRMQYDPTDIIIHLVQVLDFSELFPKGNVGSVAECIDELSGSSGDMSDVLFTLLNLYTVEELEKALVQMQPSLFTALAIAEENSTIFMRNIFSERMKEMYRGCQKKEGFSLWTTPFGARAQQKNHHLEPGYRTNTSGFFAGCDGSLSQKCSLGGGIGYDHNNLHWKKLGSKSSHDSAYAALYGLWEDSHLYLQGGMTGGYTYYRTDRHMQFVEIDRHAKGHHDGAEAAGYAELGATMRNGGFTASPFLAADYLFLHEWGFQEMGAQSLNLYVLSKNADLLSSQGGIAMSYCIERNNHFVKPHVELRAIHESRFYGKKENAKLSGICPMEIRGYYPSRTLGSANAGIDCIYSGGKLSLFYEGKYGKDYHNNSIYLEMLLAW